jgi:hypothetical protein
MVEDGAEVPVRAGGLVVPGLVVPGSGDTVATARARSTSSWLIVCVEPPKIPEPSTETVASVTPAARAAITSHPDTARARGNHLEPLLTR